MVLRVGASLQRRQSPKILANLLQRLRAGTRRGRRLKQTEVTGAGGRIATSPKSASPEVRRLERR